MVNVPCPHIPGENYPLRLFSVKQRRAVVGLSGA
jgi:hypothetical protein